LPIHENGSALVIDDDAVAREVANRMIEAGLLIEVIHFD
jgi:hypothetical protein